MTSGVLWHSVVWYCHCMHAQVAVVSTFDSPKVKSGLYLILVCLCFDFYIELCLHINHIG